MSQDEYEVQRSKMVNWWENFKTAILFIIGIGVVASSVFLFGKEWKLGEFIYDLGMAVFIAAIVELFVLRAFTSWKPEWLKISEGNRKLLDEMRAFSEENKRLLQEGKINGIAGSVDRIENRLEAVIREQDSIRRAVDEPYRVMAEATDEMSKSRSEDGA